ncbi:MAG TPA: translation initiation factor [Nitrospiraceae bacterium]|nr:translation initiation factor [Nitrospiraceae bacterium]
MKEKRRSPTSAEPIVWTSPFTVLKNIGPPLAPEVQPGVAARDASLIAPKKNHGRVDIIRQTAHRGGKTVTVVTGFTGIGLAEQETLAKEMQKACGAGGTVKEGRIEIQGDQREAVARILTNAGFRPVFAGG